MAKTQLTDVDKGRILAYIKTMSAEQVAKKIGYDSTTIQRFLIRYRKTKSIKNLPKSRRPEILTEDQKVDFIKEAMNKRYKSLYHIIKNLGYK